MSKIVSLLMIGLMVAGMGMSSCRLLKLGGHKPKQRKVEMIDTPVTTTLPDSTAAGDSVAAVNSAEKSRLITDLAPVWSRDIDYQTFSGKAKMTYEGKGQSNDFTANFRIRKDSVIWVSITALGGMVNVARALITPDSIRTVVYLEKSVRLMKMEDASKLLPAAVDFKALQNFIVGNALIGNSQPVDATDFGGTWTVQMNDTAFVQQLAFNKADSSMRTGQLKSLKENGPAIIINYGNYEKPDGRRFADSRTINILNNGQQSYLEMNFSNVVFDQALDYPFSVPAKYAQK